MTNGYERLGYERLGYERAEYDWYVEPDFAVHALIDNISIIGEVYDPFCGRGTIPRIFNQAGYQTKASDIVDRGYGRRYDFLSGGGSPYTRNITDKHTDNIVCNPPFHKDNIRQIIDRALFITHHKVCMLLPIAFLATQGRYKLFQNTPVATILILSGRPSMPPGAMLEENLKQSPGYVPSGGKKDFIWIVWDHNHNAYPTIMWADPEKYSVRAWQKRAKRGQCDG